MLNNIDKALRIGDLNLSESLDNLKSLAIEKARLVKLAQESARARILSGCADDALMYGIENIPSDETEQLKKFGCDSWWFKQFKTLKKRKLEQVARDLELVHKHQSSYVSNYTNNRRRQEKLLSRQFLESTYINNELGEEFSLAEVYDKNVSNPAIRRAELMVRAKGFEELAEYHHHQALFITLTTPSRFHQIKANGTANPKFNGATPREAHHFLNEEWKLIRSAIHKKQINPYGFRVVEPHHDSTPHWHLLLFIHPDDTKNLIKTFQHYALQDEDTNRINLKHRIKCVTIDPEKGTATGYIAKYISKNIDGHAIEKDLDGKDATEAARKIEAWASNWGIRQFQQIGGAPVTIWRELRKLRDPVDNPIIEQARKAADSSDWAAYNLAMGGVNLPRSARPIQPYYEEQEINLVFNTDTGEVINEPNIVKKLKGLSTGEQITITRKHEWKISGSVNSVNSGTEITEFAEQPCGRGRHRGSGRGYGRNDDQQTLDADEIAAQYEAYVD